MGYVKEMSAASIMTGLLLPRPNWKVNPWSGTHFDAEVAIGREARPGWDLTLTVRVDLVCIIPPNGPATFVAGRLDDQGVLQQFTVVRWTTAEVGEFRQKFEQNVTKVWDNRLAIYLRGALDESPPGLLPDPSADPAKLFNCRLRVQTSGPFHVSITVAKPASGQKGFAASLDRDQLVGPTNGYFNFDDADFKFRTGGDPIRHNTAAHEIGHLLGLGHPGAAEGQCLAKPGHQICYGRNRWEQLGVMGLGLQVRPEHATPWMEALGHITGASTALMTAYPLPKK
jgi:hypothetical protein